MDSLKNDLRIFLFYELGLEFSRTKFFDCSIYDLKTTQLLGDDFVTSHNACEIMKIVITESSSP